MANKRRKASVIERRAHTRADREDPLNHGHPLTWFRLTPFINHDVLHAWAVARNNPKPSHPQPEPEDTSVPAWFAEEHDPAPRRQP